jgi:hypothetical protein
LLAGWLFSQQREGHSRIYGTVIFGFTGTGVMKQAWSGAVYIQTAFILVDLEVYTSVACLFELWKQLQ